MNKVELRNEFMPYPESLLEDWKAGNHSMLMQSNASDYIKNILTTKAKIRQGRRFFGEAYIASKIEMKEGWYNSFKWLTADKWLIGESLESEFEKPFHEALMKHIGANVLSKLQAKANEFFNNHKEKFMHEGKYKKPVAPDLWLIDKDGSFRFIESKLPGDTIAAHQIAGLALIGKYLGDAFPVSISIIHLYPEDIDPVRLYSEFYNLA